MCGIAGILTLDGREPPRRNELEQMLSQLQHRGPDGSGIHVEGPMGLAHTRLSIIDLLSGAQPIHNEDRSVWVTFNGEIFNYLELRGELEAAGHRFSTNSDTEVIVHLYEEMGEDFVQRLNGQFAIGLWDGRRRRLVLARDRVGIRPLFHATSGGRLMFASEVKALFASASLPRRLEPRAIAQVCTYWAALDPCAVFSGVESLPPGHVLTVDAAGRRLRRYWDWDFGRTDLGADMQEQAQELRRRLVDAVRLQLRSDVPVGAYLSGGLDSSIIAAVIRHCTGTALRTFSLTFEDAEFDESTWQRELAAELGSEHTAIRCTRQDISREFPRTVWHAETPLVRTAPTPLMLLSGHVRQAGFKVVMSGEGADEVFGGYDLFKEAKIRRFWARQPGSRFRPLILQKLYPYLANSPVRSGGFAAAFFADGIDQVQSPWFAHLPRWRTTGRIRNFFSSSLRERLADWDPLADIATTLPADMNSWPSLGCDQYVEAHTLMSGYLLSSQGDRVAMANSVEGRVPFLDHHLIEFASRLPPWLKIRGLREKYLLRRAFADILPESIVSRPKQPYRAPDSQSFFHDGKPAEYVAELMAPAAIRDAGYFDAQATARLFEKCRSGRAIGFADNMSFVAILSTMLLHRQFIAGRGLESC